MKNILLFSLPLIISINCFAISKDSANRLIAFSFNKQEMQPFSNKNSEIDQAFNNVNQYSISALIQNKIYTYKLLSINTHIGIKASITKIGNIQVEQLSHKINDKINSKSYNLAFNSGVSMDISLFKNKNSEIQLGLGILTSGYFFNPVKTNTYVYERNDFYGKDSIEISYNRNNIFEINPFFQVNLKKKIKSKNLIIGLRYFFMSLNGRPDNIEYKFFVSKFPTTPINYSGYFSTFKLPLSCFIGFNI